jgi:hypothetical protein
MKSHFKIDGKPRGGKSSILSRRGMISSPDCRGEYLSLMRPMGEGPPTEMSVRDDS